MAEPFKLQETSNESPHARTSTFENFRRWGYLDAELDPLAVFTPLRHPELQLAGEFADNARRIYCGAIGAEFMHMPDKTKRDWVAQRMETEPTPPSHMAILKRLVQAEIFEQVLQTRYLGTKRFSLEGLTALIPLLDEILLAALDRGAREVMIGMSHRGRLNVMTHIAGIHPRDIMAGFEDVDPRSVLGSGDVKYHVGATGTYAAADGRLLEVHLVSNPSHLEAVDPVVAGRTRAKHTRYGEGIYHTVVPVVIHGDGAIAGQGIFSEVLNLSDVKGFEVGGTVHIVANNRIGFTTTPAELHSTRFASDAAKRMPIPVFHVNGDDPDAATRVGRMALEYRHQFHSDVVIDLIGYRRHGHSEIDDPTITQPLLYNKIRSHPQLWRSYADRNSIEVDSVVDEVRREYEAAQVHGTQAQKIPKLRKLPSYWSGFNRGKYRHELEVETGVSAEILQDVSRRLTTCPADFHVHPKIKKLLEQRAAMGAGNRPVDFAYAEALAFGTLLREGTPIRLSGQDSRRGTFNQRQSALVDVQNENEYVPLEHASDSPPFCQIFNSTLSEAAVLGFEYGFSRDYPEALVMWEAQFGDFANGAQIVIDQFISAAEDKWDLPSGVVLLLPHGYEGQGPEHSSARLERFLQLCAEDNMQVCQPSTASQYFHLLRRQALRKFRKPMVVMTPKSMLRSPDATSPISEFSIPRFQTVIADQEIEAGRRVLVCSGKIGHELRAERRKRKNTSTAIVVLDQLYPFPEQELAAELAKHSGEIVWVQEEPANMGALFYVAPRLRRLFGSGRSVRTIKRSASASPATGSAKAHALEQNTLLALAFTTGSS